MGRPPAPPRPRARRGNRKETPRQAAERAEVTPELPTQLPRRGPDCEAPTASTMSEGAAGLGRDAGDADFAVQEGEEKYAARKMAAYERRRAWYAERARVMGRAFGFQIKFTPELRLEFLGALEQFGAILTAADWCGATTTTIDNHRKSDPTFEEEVKAALERHRLALVAEARRRAIDGYLVPVFGKDGFVGTERKFSDSLLTTLLKAKGGAEFRDKVDVTSTNTNVNVPVPPVVADKLASLTREQRAALRLLLGPADAPPAPVASPSEGVDEGDDQAQE